MNTDDLEKIYKNVYHELSGANVSFTVRYYHYAGLKSRIVQERTLFSKKYVLKLSSGFCEFPETFHVALAHLLLSKATGKRCSVKYRRIYKKWMNLDSSEDLHNKLRKDYGRKVSHSPQGDVFNLEDCFSVLNEKYFEGVLSMPKLKWGVVDTYRKFGHYDPSSHVIHISRSLDSENVPCFVLNYVVFHEMLHIVVGSRKSVYSRVVHGKEFRDLEKKFERFEDANVFLKKLAQTKLKRRKSVFFV